MSPKTDSKNGCTKNFAPTSETITYPGQQETINKIKILIANHDNERVIKKQDKIECSLLENAAKAVMRSDLINTYAEVPPHTLDTDTPRIISIEIESDDDDEEGVMILTPTSSMDGEGGIPLFG